MNSATTEAQTPSPSATVQAYFDALAAEHWSVAASFLRVEDFSRIRRDHIDMYSPSRFRPRTAEDFLRRDSTMPPAVAEYQARRFNETAARAANLGELEVVFAGVRDTALLRAMTLDQVAARWLEARDLRHQTRLMLRLDPTCPQELDSATREALAPRVEVLGEVIRGDTSWVVLRSRSEHVGMALPGAAPDDARTATLVRRGDRWLIVPSQHYGYQSIGLSRCRRQR